MDTNGFGPKYSLHHSMFDREAVGDNKSRLAEEFGLWSDTAPPSPARAGSAAGSRRVKKLGRVERVPPTKELGTNRPTSLPTVPRRPLLPPRAAEAGTSDVPRGGGSLHQQVSFSPVVDENRRSEDVVPR